MNNLVINTEYEAIRRVAKSKGVHLYALDRLYEEVIPYVNCLKSSHDDLCIKPSEDYMDLVNMWSGGLSIDINALKELEGFLSKQLTEVRELTKKLDKSIFEKDITEIADLDIRYKYLTVDTIYRDYCNSSYRLHRIPVTFGAYLKLYYNYYALVRRKARGILILDEEKLKDKYSYSEDDMNRVTQLFKKVDALDYRDILKIVVNQLRTDSEQRAYLEITLAIIKTYKDDKFDFTCNAKEVINKIVPILDQKVQRI